MMSDDNMDNTDITGRDSYIMAEALYLAIKWINAQPKEYRSLSNQEDMQAILDARWPSFKEIFAQTARPAVVLKFPRLVSDSDDGPPEGTA
jgi:hypothetical protein